MDFGKEVPCIIDMSTIIDKNFNFEKLKKTWVAENQKFFTYFGWEAL